MSKVTRKEIADGLKKAVNSYFLKKGFACHNEIGIASWGKRRVDMLALNLRGEIVIAEVKSCVADFTTDDKQSKWQTYLASCNRFYWVFTEDTARLLERHFDRLRKSGCGVLVLDKSTGYLRSLVPAKRRPMRGEDKRNVIIRMAWRNGDVSRRNSRRVRVFLEGDKT